MAEINGNKKDSVSYKEQEVLDFWNKNKIFEKSMEKPAPSNGASGKMKNDFVFYDGPPFATGTPHYGHIVGNILKDAIPRYQTMKGKKVPRKWGWDCHGLPIENLIEQELNLASKKDIETYGIGKFNEAAEASVFRYADYWKNFIPRIGRWADMEDDYRTMDWKYTESIWWVFKTLYDKGLIYKGHKSMHICPRCETTLSNFEVNQPDAYRDIKDISVTVKFELEDEPGTYVLAWTTTPWTLPGNVALAVNPEIDYVKVKIFTGIWNDKGDAVYNKVILAKDIYNNLKKEPSLIKAEPFHFLFSKIPEGYQTPVMASVLEEFKGSDLIGKSYKPIFGYYTEEEKRACPPHLSETQSSDCGRGWKIYGADFVTTEDGTGVVHIAPAFGEDDMNLGKKEKLPFIQHVGMDGKFKFFGIPEFEGLQVKPKDTKEDKFAHARTDIKVIEWLKNNGSYFGEEKITHSYPHCWRCDTPLLNYAASSWFMAVEKIKDKLIANNKKINWVPAHLKEGRFGKGLETAPDWSISRSRYWGAPLPVWVCQTEGCGEIKAIGSIKDIKKNVYRQGGNKFFLIRHGESENNVEDILNTDVAKNHYHLTEKGRTQSLESAEKLKNEGKKIDLIFSSEFLRAKETAEIAAGVFGIEKNQIITDARINEIKLGDLEGHKVQEYHDFFADMREKYIKGVPGGENLMQVKKRMSEFLKEVDGKYSGKNILVVSHEYPLWLAAAGAAGFDFEQSVAMRTEEGGSGYIHNAEIRQIEFLPIPRNGEDELDLHRPYIDEVVLKCEKCLARHSDSEGGRGEMKRVQEVFDCWFESGSMPYGQVHYPFDSDSISSQSSANYGAGGKGVSDINPPKNFPAEFIAEGIDQTRGWFYTLLVLSTALFDEPAYKNVVVNGILLTEDGQKMSKRLKNYPDPLEVVEKYGADALRYYLLSSPAVRAESLNFSEKGVDEVYKKVLSRLRNVVTFYETYGGIKNISVDWKPEHLDEGNVLDRWIYMRLNLMREKITNAMDAYEIDKAVRPIGDFVEDLSVWYTRRSRDRFKDEGIEKDRAISTMRGLLYEFSVLIAPFMPFIAEEIYQKIRNENSANMPESVHLENWPVVKTLQGVEEEARAGALSDMDEVRKICSLALEARKRTGIKVRQPLGSLKVKELKIKDQNQKRRDGLIGLIKEEINVKEIIIDEKIGEDVELDINITEDLKKEGIVREFLRNVQDLRKEKGLTPEDVVALNVETDENGEKLLREFGNEIKKTARFSELKFGEVAEGEKFEIEGMKFKVKI